MYLKRLWPDAEADSDTTLPENNLEGSIFMTSVAGISVKHQRSRPGATKSSAFPHPLQEEIKDQGSDVTNFLHNSNTQHDTSWVHENPMKK